MSLQFTIFNFLLCFAQVAEAAEVALERVPEAGVQPQVTVAADGTVHLVYLKGEAKGADIRYTRRGPADKSWQPPVTVNSVPHSAVAIGTIRGAQLAAGRGGRIHVVWNGAAAGGDHAAAALWYSHSDDEGFAPQRDVRGQPRHLDGGASIAADSHSGVFVVWHASAADAAPNETNRIVYVRTSSDDGATFAAAHVANAARHGVCACCSLKACAAADGTLFTFYRAAQTAEQRDMTLLTVTPGSASFKRRAVHPWKIAACPMSSAALLPAGSSMRGAWESDRTVFTALLDQPGPPLAVSQGEARHPALAVNARGETLITWSVGTGWQRGGQLGWVILNTKGDLTDRRGTSPGVPVWSHTAAFPVQDGSFVILY